MPVHVHTAGGRFIDILDIKPEDVDINDIAHQLAIEPRFTSATPVPYSVGQHSILVAQHCRSESPVDKLWCLLHDAHEIYTRDISRPMKEEFRRRGITFYDELSAKVQRAICQRFGLPEVEPPCVKEADNLLLATEAKHFFGDTHAYKSWEHRPENGHKIITPSCIFQASWLEVKVAFLRAYYQLSKEVRDEASRSQRLAGGSPVVDG